MKCRVIHPEVEAFVITKIGVRDFAGGTVSCDDGSTRLITDEQMVRLKPEAGDYFVIQPNGHIYISPKEIFISEFAPVSSPRCTRPKCGGWELHPIHTNTAFANFHTFIPSAPPHPAPEPENSAWTLCSERLPSAGIELEVKLLNCGSILKGAVLQSDGEWWWEHKFFSAGSVESWRIPAAPPSQETPK